MNAEELYWNLFNDIDAKVRDADPTWISVHDTQPNKNEKVILLKNMNINPQDKYMNSMMWKAVELEIVVGWLTEIDNEGNCYWTTHGGAWSTIFNVTHWKPMPPPPVISQPSYYD